MTHPFRTYFQTPAQAGKFADLLIALGHTAVVDPEVPSAVDHDAPPDVHDEAIAVAEAPAAPEPPATVEATPTAPAEEAEPHSRKRRSRE
jgi:hypothetical protein